MSQNELNHHNDPAGLLRSLEGAAGELPYLGDVDAIDKILRDLVGGITYRFAEVGRGNLTPQEAADADRAECERLAVIFDGQGEGYAAIQNWNGEGLAKYIRSRMAESVPDDEDDETVIAQAFGVFVHGVYGVIGKAADGMSEEDLADSLQDLVRAFSWTLVGLESHE
jgi:hypothetical protein